MCIWNLQPLGNTLRLNMYCDSTGFTELNRIKRLQLKRVVDLLPSTVS